jgi:L-alanine-DL-glutamate epimerase-like enolase superfamily enzyme
MAGVTLGPAELARALGELRVHVEAVEVIQSAVPLPDYPGGPRPSSVLRVRGGGHVGQGENVAFDAAEHARFATSAQAWFRSLPHATLRVATVPRASDAPYERAALEAALIDLGLRQAGLSLSDLTGTRSAALRFVASFAVGSDPARVVAEQRARGYSGDFKVDVDPTWAPGTIATLSREPSIAIFDFKMRGDAQLAQQLATLLPRTLLEDPPASFADFTAPSQRHRISRDAPLLDATAVSRAVARGEAVNLKAPRMAGPLEVLRGLGHALGTGSLAYMGGMFEVGVGRTQAQQLAALYCATAPNDLAPNLPSTVATTARCDSPLTIHLDSPGFGRTP